MIPVCRDEISPRPAGTDLTLQLHVEIKFRPSKARQFSTWHLLIFECNVFEFFFVTMSVYELKTHNFRHIRKVGPETRDCWWDLRPETRDPSHKWEPEHETLNV